MLIRIIFCYTVLGLLLPWLIYISITKPCRAFGGRRAWRVGRAVGLSLWVVIVGSLLWATFIGNYRIGVRYETFASRDVPREFDGYRIVHLSDWHLGGMSASELSKANAIIDSVNALRPDLIVFTGDLQNTSPEDTEPFLRTLHRLRAPDGVLSILGNHDYPRYIHADSLTRLSNLRRSVALQKAAGWKVLRDDTVVIRRGGKRLLVAGLEDGYEYTGGAYYYKRQQALHAGADFNLMLVHQPMTWKDEVLPVGKAHLTLAGHIHAMQVQIGSWSPAVFLCKYWGGMYREGRQALEVSKGLGGAIPLRIGLPCEIVLIKLKVKR